MPNGAAASAHPGTSQIVAQVAEGARYKRQLTGSQTNPISTPTNKVAFARPRLRKSAGSCEALQIPMKPARVAQNQYCGARTSAGFPRCMRMPASSEQWTVG